ncbi:23S rRNA (pseudouridine(1915)-N(3))-methyltransferase RlmH [Marinicella sp. W31]|uniref:23S rRNA (pseudouridine(1915)-N(3))-methyltransferase RlmH n=1 Tax=Marinicella sp. W31 TaxID=3023713 RepID=UPI0037571AB3
MKITLLAIGHKMPDWVSDTFNLYNQRLPHKQQIHLQELPPVKRGKTTSVAAVKAAEADVLLKKITSGSVLVALDERGKSLSTKGLSQHIGQWQQQGRDVFIVIGGADGLDQTVLQAAQQIWSLSRLTFPHQLVRVIMAEQIYRAYSLLNNHPYHRE